MDMNNVMQVQMKVKSGAVAVLLVFVFGGIGLFYTSIIIGVFGTMVEIILFIATVFTIGWGAVLYIPWRIVCLIIALLQISAYNRSLLKKYGTTSPEKAIGEITGEIQD